MKALPKSFEKVLYHDRQEVDASRLISRPTRSLRRPVVTQSVVDLDSLEARISEQEAKTLIRSFHWLLSRGHLRS